MKQNLIRFSIAAVLLIVLLLVPLVVKDKGHPPLVGPDLSELSYAEVFFENPHKDLRLGGMLFVPAGEGPFPAAVIIHGSGTSRRNNVWYLSVARHLQQNGIAVLLPDKRGSEKSEGEWLGASFEDLATDSLSAIDFLKVQERLAVSTMGLIGMSQGGWIAPVVAAQAPDLAFVVSMSGAAVTPEAQLRHEEIHNIAPYTYTFIAKLIAPLSSRQLMKKAFFRPTAGFDPIPHWKAVKAPVLFALGDGDENVPVAASLARLKASGLDHFAIKVYPQGGHAIRDLHTHAVSHVYLEDLVAFIKAAGQ